MAIDKFRAPHEIISDLLWFAEMDLDDLEHPERYDEVKAEAKRYLDKIKADAQAWANIEELHKTCVFDQAGVRWDPGL